MWLPYFLHTAGSRATINKTNKFCPHGMAELRRLPSYEPERGSGGKREEGAHCDIRHIVLCCVGEKSTAAQILIHTQDGHLGRHRRIILLFVSPERLPFVHPILFSKSTGYLPDILQPTGIQFLAPQEHLQSLFMQLCIWQQHNA